MAYGVNDAGFTPKLLAEILADIENDETAVFGGGTILDSQSPLGQWNGITSDAIAELWEMAQAVYASFDVDQASGARLDLLGKIRHVPRASGQSDESYRAAISLASTAFKNGRQIRAALLAVDGVTDAWVTENNTNRTAASGLPGNSLAIAVEGGDDEDIAQVIWDETVPGVGLFGNTSYSLTLDGYCRTLAFTRPEAAALNVEVEVYANSACGCAPASTDDLKTTLITNIGTNCGYGVGASVKKADIAQLLGCAQGVNVVGVRLSRGDDDLGDGPAVFTLYERPEVTTDTITVKWTSNYDEDL